MVSLARTSVVVLALLTFSTLTNSAFAIGVCASKTAQAALPFGSRTVKLQLGIQTRVLAAAFVPKNGPPLIVGALEHDDSDVHIFDLAKLGEYDSSLGRAKKVGRDNNYATQEIIVAKGGPYFATCGGQKVSFYDGRDTKKSAMVLKVKLNNKVVALEGGKFLVVDETQKAQIVSTDATTGIEVEEVSLPISTKNFESIAVTSAGNKYLVAISNSDGKVSVLALSKSRRVWKLELQDSLTVTKETLKGVRTWSEAPVTASKLVWLNRPAASSEKPPVLIAAVHATTPAGRDGDQIFPGVLTGWKVEKASARGKHKLTDYIEPFKTGSSSISELVSPKESGHVVLNTSDPASIFSSLKVKESRTKATFQSVWSERLPRNAGVHYLSSSSGPQDPIHSLAVSPDGKTVVVGSDGGVLVKRSVDTRRGREQAAFEGSDIRALAFSADSQWLAAGGHMGEFYLYQLVSSTVPPRFSEEEGTPRPEDVDTGDFSF